MTDTEKVNVDGTETEPIEEHPPVEEAGQTSKKDTDLAAQVDKWKALSRKNEARAQENAEKAKKWDEYERAAKDLEKKRIEADEKVTAELAAATVRALRAETALKYGLTSEDVALLGEGDIEDFDKRAQALAQRIGKTAPGRDPALGQENAKAGKSKDFIREALTR